MTNKCLAATLLLGGLLLAGKPLVGQNALPQSVEPAASRDAASLDQQIAMLRSDLRSNRKQIIAANMKLTDVEAVKVLAYVRQIRPRAGANQRGEICDRQRIPSKRKHD
jgi:hypothetical protein